MQWFSKNNRTLKSNELQPILDGSADLHLFVKREDADGLEFYYLGQAEVRHAEERHMTGNKDELLAVVVMRLGLDEPAPAPLYKALTTNKRSSIQDPFDDGMKAERHRNPGHMVREDSEGKRHLEQ